MAEAKTLYTRIWQSLQKDCSDAKNCFLPLSSQRDILTPDLIDLDLSQVKDHAFEDEREIAEYINSSSKQLYAILVMLNKQATITDFMRQGIKDEHLPFQLRAGQTGPLESHRKNYKVKIHESHHAFREQNGDYFALKELHSRIKPIFEDELENLRKLKPHHNLVNLLAAFSRKSTFYFLFPWANGGNLKDFWEEVTSPVFEDWVHWVAQQCAGLADGLAEIHDVKPVASGISEAEVFTDDGKNFGRHGDIKPENVLVFKKDPADGGNVDKGTLKLCDFGLTVFHSLRSRSTDRASAQPQSLTYNAPEGDADRTISRRYDTWCLGCLYLELITWLLRGKTGLETFSANRREEHGVRRNVTSDQFFKLHSRYNSIYKTKKAVVNWIQELQALETCSDFIYDFLDYVRDHMLQSNQSNRDIGHAVRDRFQALYKKCDNEGYLRGKNRRTSGHGGSSTEPAPGLARSRSRRFKRSIESDEQTYIDPPSHGKRNKGS
ncbi:putative Protein kinase domain-containing protein [Seiridium cardinale]|uniref:Protein kinase domain-containing protein n=1 Tax=Seiridium cardinale TaxID=138064 RepID=A0ABR2X6G8_9PEZI